CVHPDRVTGTAFNFYWYGDPQPASEHSMDEPTFLHDGLHIMPESRRLLKDWDAFAHPYLNGRRVLTSNDSLFTLGSRRDCPGQAHGCLDGTEALRGTVHPSPFGHADIA